MTREIPGRKYDDNEMWNTINKCTVELISESEKARADRMVKECQTEEEILLDQFTDSLYNNGERFADAENVESASTIVDLTGTNDHENNEENTNFRYDNTFELDPATLAEAIDVNVNEGEEDELRNVEVEDDSNEFEIRDFGKIKRSTVNPIAINQDIIAYGKLEMRKLNLEIVRVREKDRRSRYKKMSSAVVRDIASHNEKNENETSFMEESIERNMDAIISNGSDN